MSALISDCGQYRYWLRRKTGCPLRWVRKCLFIMLNPSTADAEKDDATIRRCVTFAQKNGCPDLTVVNLFGLRATNPKFLAQHQDPVGPDNWQHIEREIRDHQIIVAAWGAHPMVLTSESRQKILWLADDLDLKCLGLTKTGHPRHPLYVPNAQEFINYGGSV